MPDELSADSSHALVISLRAEWRYKAFWTLLINACFWTPYMILAHHPLLPVHTLPWTWLDERTGFHPRPWIWIYESVFLLTGLTPWLLSNRAHIHRYLRGFALLATVSFVVFLCLPVNAPRPLDWQEQLPFSVLVPWDGPGNAFPSLHAGTLTLSMLLLLRIIRNAPPRAPAWRASSLAKHSLTAFLVLWAALILLATLTTKQHYAWDLVAGGLLGAAADSWAWRSWTPPR